MEMNLNHIVNVIYFLMNLNPQKEKENLQLHEIQFLMIQYERISLKEIHFVFSVSVYL
jgi:hypothetical protein